jgi:hypothetical protein
MLLVLTEDAIDVVNITTLKLVIIAINVSAAYYTVLMQL